jgi:hypothetical protein
MTTSQNVSPQALAVIAGALAGAAVGLFLISWLEIGRDFRQIGCLVKVNERDLD